MHQKHEKERQVRPEVRVPRSGVDGFSPAALRRRRAQRRLSLSDLADLSGVSETTINSWELGHALPTPSTLATVAKALGTRIADLAPVPESDLKMADLRHHLGQSQDDTASAAGLSRARLAAIETGRRQPRDSELDTLASLYDVTSEQLAGIWQRTRERRLARLRNK